MMGMKTHSALVFVVLIGLYVTPVNARVAKASATPAATIAPDPDPFVLGNVTYSSHANVITATDTKSGKLLWQTKVSMAVVKPNNQTSPTANDDQWNKIMQITSQKNVLQIMDSKGKTYRLDRRNGRLLR
jgi:outer membrane protein assembly factor BamB